MTARREHAVVRWGLVGLLAFGALNAFAGGWYGMADARDVPLSLLEGSPFESYFWPSVILFVVVGGSMAAASVLVLLRVAWAPIAAITAGVILVGWIAVQVTIIGWMSWLQPISAAVGLAVIAMAAVLSVGRARDAQGRIATFSTPSPRSPNNA
jgi:hypothetical protein